MRECLPDAEAEVTYSAGDIVAINLLIWRFWAMVAASIAGLLASLFIIFGLLDGIPFTAAVALVEWRFIARMTLVLVIWVIVVTALKYVIRRWKGMHGPIRFRLTAEGVRFRNREMDGEVFWTAVKSVRVRGDRLFLFISKRSGFIIPRRAFANSEGFATFVQHARDSWEGSRR